MREGRISLERSHGGGWVGLRLEAVGVKGEKGKTLVVQNESCFPAEEVGEGLAAVLPQHVCDVIHKAGRTQL